MSYKLWGGVLYCFLMGWMCLVFLGGLIDICLFLNLSLNLSLFLSLFLNLFLNLSLFLKL